MLDNPVAALFTPVRANLDKAMGEWFFVVTTILTISVLLFAADRVLLLFVEWQESLESETPSASILNNSGFYRFYQYRQNLRLARFERGLSSYDAGVNDNPLFYDTENPFDSDGYSSEEQRRSHKNGGWS